MSSLAKIFTLVIITGMMNSCTPAGKITGILEKEKLPVRTEPGGGKTDLSLEKLLSKYPDSFKDIMVNKDKFRLQIIYTKINRDKKGQPHFIDYYYNVNPDLYFYPASTVKLPTAILALQKINELNIPGVDRNATMITEKGYSGQTEVYNDPSSPDGRPSISQYIKKILLVSNNDANNRLYEFLGQKYLNEELHKRGYQKAQILHRLDISLSEDENRQTNPVSFYDTAGSKLYEQQMQFNTETYEQRGTKLGEKYMQDGSIVNAPFDFSKKNRLTLPDLHSILESVIFPESIPAERRFNLMQDDLSFLRKYMSEFPSESDFPQYDSSEYNDAYVKFLLYGNEKGKLPGDIRIFNKTGDAYGFLIDAAYIADFKNNVEFILCATIYCNSDGIINDDRYDYKTIGYPFMKKLGEVIYDYERTRKRTHKPDLSTFQFSYNK